MASIDRRDLIRAGTVAAAWAAVVGVTRAAPTGDFLDAVIQGDLPRVRGMLDADPGLLHVRDSERRTAYALALLNGRPQVAEFLKERGYSPDLHESALTLDWERFEELAQTTPGALDLDHPVGGTAMYAAALGGAGSQIWRVYRYGGEPDVAPRGTAGYTPLRAALEHEDLATAELTAATLLGNGADPGGPQRGGDSPLHAASRRGSVEIVEMLIRKGAKVDAVNDAGRTPLESARASGRTAVVSVLRNEASIPRDHSTSRTAYDVNGRPYRASDLDAFAYASRGQVVGAAHFDLDAVRRSVDRHPVLAHSVATTTEGAVEAGAHMGRTDIVDYLLEAGAPYGLPTAVMRNDLPRVRGLLEEDLLRIHERGPHDFALLWYPVIGGALLDMAELLLDAGAEVEGQHWLGTTALHFAAASGQVEMAALLIERGADVNRVGRKFDAVGMTPLQTAVARGQDDVARLLRERGARG